MTPKTIFGAEAGKSVSKSEEQHCADTWFSNETHRKPFGHVKR